MVRTETVSQGFTEIGPGQHINAAFPDNHLFGIQDTIAGGVSGMGETMCIQNHNFRSYFGPFPNVQRDRLLSYIESVKRSPNGNAHDLYKTNGDPFILWANVPEAPIQGGTDSRPPIPGESQWLDSPVKFIFSWYAFAKMQDDRELLELAWPAIKQEISWLLGTIEPGKHLPSEPPMMSNPFSIVPQGPGPGVYNSGFYLLGLQLAIASGEMLGVESDYVASLKKTFAEASNEFENIFWDDSKQCYHFAAGGPYQDAMSYTTFYPQFLAEMMELPDLLNPDRVKLEMTTHYYTYRRYNAKYQMMGLPLLMREGGLVRENGTVPLEVDWVTVGDNFSAAAGYYTAGKRYQAPELSEFGLEIGDALARQIWLEPGNGLAFAAPWGYFNNDSRKCVYPGYSQALAIWDLLNAIKPLETL